MSRRSEKMASARTELAEAQERLDRAIQDLSWWQQQTASKAKAVEYCKKRVEQAKQRLIPRGRDESPVQYYQRTGRVDDRYTHVHKGRYYCNPAHCKHSWTNKKARDEHLRGAYAALD